MNFNQKNSEIWVYAEQHAGVIHPVAFELLGTARKLADDRGLRVTAAVIGDLRASCGEDLIAAGADHVFLVTHETLKLPMELPYEEILYRLVSREQPDILLFGATPFGRSLAPRLAAHLGTGLTADCTSLSIDPESGLLKQVRPAFGGSLMAEIVCPVMRPQMATVRPGVFPRPTPDFTRGGSIERIWQPAGTPKVTVLRTEARRDGRSIAGAKRLVIAGRGIGLKKNLALVEELATLLDADWGCTRPLVENGWCESFRQVGQTGCSVSPELLVSVGVSGAVQHTAGISGAKQIIAVNKDPAAQIFASASYAVEGDCVQFMKSLISELRANPPMRTIWGSSEEYNG